MAIRSNKWNRMRVVVAGDAGTGKSSLIVTAVLKNFPAKVHPVLPPLSIPANVIFKHIPVTIIDTPSGSEYSNIRAEEFVVADVVMLTYDCDRFDTLKNLRRYWLPELHRLKVKVPVVIVGCKADLRIGPSHITKEQLVKAVCLIQDKFPNCAFYGDCSAYLNQKVSIFFKYGLKHAFYPTPQLFDLKTQTLTPQCRKALKRIFLLCDLDRDGALNDAELNDFQVKCFNVPLKPSEIVALKRAVQDKFPEGVTENGLTLQGFLFHHESVTLEAGIHLMWIILHKFGYSVDIRLTITLDYSPKRAPDVVERGADRCFS